MSEGPKFVEMSSIDHLKGQPLGRVLIKIGCLTREQLHHVLDVQKEQRVKGMDAPLGEMLVEMGLISENVCNMALAAQMGNERMYRLAEQEERMSGDNPGNTPSDVKF